MAQSIELPRKLMLLISALQGIALLLLYDAAESGTWPSQSPLWNYPLWLVSVALPVLLLLSLEKGRERRTAIFIGAFMALLIPIAIYIGWQASPYNAFPVYNLTTAFVASIGLGCFKALMYLQQRAAEKPMTYSVLFTYSWRNSLTVALASLLVFVFWLLLFLWGSLFQAINIDFFHDLFEQSWFLFPVLSVAFGAGLTIFRNLTGVIDSITRLFEGLIRILLPLAAVVSVVFLAALPFVGLDALWSTGRGTSLLLLLLAAILFFTNAVYQDGRGEMPYPPVVHRILYVALLTTPVISALSFYGLYLRLEEYGWTVIRGWAFVVWLVLALFSIGYFVGIVRKRDEWTQDLARVNTGMGLFVMVLMLLLNSPLLDLRKLSLRSQISRLESGQVEPGDFDFWYARHSLGRPGFLFMEEMKAKIGDSDPSLLARIDNPAQTGYGQRHLTSDEFWEKTIFRPEPFIVPEELREMIPGGASQAYGGDLEPFLIRVDLDADKTDEYVLLYVFQHYLVGGELYYLDDGRWRSGELDTRHYPGTGADAREALLNGAISIEPQRFQLLKIDDIVVRPMQ